MNILYEDSHLLVCVKPPEVLSQPDLGGGVDMLTILKAYLEDKNESGYVGLIHRLDRNVGGVMVFSKKAIVTSKLSVAIQERNFIKEYFAIVHNCPQEKTGTYTDLLYKDSSKNKSFVVDRPRKGVKEAILEYDVIDTKSTQIGEISLVRIRLQTGRTHQIRVQFASRKMPLVGDGKYGSKDNACDIALWSCRLSFKHPIKKGDIDITQVPPNCYPWNLFEIKKQ